MNLEFTPFPKMARLNREIVITEKLDGTNAAVVIRHKSEIDHIDHENGLWDLFDNAERSLTTYVGDYAVFTQSRTRFIVPGQDNYGLRRMGVPQRGRPRRRTRSWHALR